MTLFFSPSCLTGSVKFSWLVAHEVITVHESSNCEMHISHQNCLRLLRPRPRLERSIRRVILSKVSSQKVPLLAQLSSSK